MHRLFFAICPNADAAVRIAQPARRTSIAVPTACDPALPRHGGDSKFKRPFPCSVAWELLAKLIEDYEKERFKFHKPEPVEAIVFRMEQRGLRQKDIAALLGGKNRASEVLAKKRPLTLPMIRAIHEKLDIPAEILIHLRPVTRCFRKLGSRPAKRRANVPAANGNYLPLSSAASYANTRNGSRSSASSCA